LVHSFNRGNKTNVNLTIIKSQDLPSDLIRKWLNFYYQSLTQLNSIFKIFY